MKCLTFIIARLGNFVAFNGFSRRLHGKESRPPLKRVIDPPLMRQEIDPLDISVRENMHAHTPLTDERRAGVYSPITFQDVARRSIASSPIKYPNTPRGKMK